ncbi:MAG: MotA/TolQ/ExbB proton channel family protein [Verrucomicrobia bacterium]|jgi:biopolymer transport protein ExbB|nr:MotA/TolQ/ExbB proton channel family protein [Verrucomicrobiota bacterium]
MKFIKASKYFTLFLSVLLLAPTLMAAEGEAVAKKKTILAIIHEGGVVMYILIIASIMIMAFTIEAIIKIRQARLAPPAVLAQLRDAIISGNYPTAYQVCVSNPCYLSRIVQAGLERLGRGRDAAEKVMGEVTAKELNGIKSNIQYLSVIGVVSPMVGLTGTVVGMIKAFETLGSSGAADPSKLAGNISEVLVATGTGLFVAIPAFVLYYVFRNRIQTVSVAVDSDINLLFEDVPFEQLTGYRLADYLGNASAPAVA